MSGPKVSVYEISVEQRQNLRAQLDCFQQSVVCCEEIKKSLAYLNEKNASVHALLSTFQIVHRRTGDCSSEISALAEYQNLLPQVCQSFLQEFAETPLLPVNNFILTKAELTNRKNTLAKLRALCNNILAKHKELEIALTPMEEKARQGVKNVESTIAQDVEGVASFCVLPEESPNETFECSKHNVENQLRALALNTACSGELKIAILSASTVLSRITSSEQLKNFQAVTVRPLQNWFEAAVAEKDAQTREYATLCTRLVALCSAAGMEQEKLPPDDGNLAQLKRSVTELEKRIVTQTEQAYISNCVNEVMSEMGYDIIGNRSVTKKSGKRFKNELFSYGDGTAINVTYDSEGQIAMELGGIDRTDRIPTTEETAVLEADMESFCSDFNRFEQRLKEKGVTIKSRVSMAPPSGEYATIINLTDYTITSTTPVQEITVSDTRAKATPKRALHKEDNAWR